MLADQVLKSTHNKTGANYVHQENTRQTMETVKSVQWANSPLLLEPLNVECVDVVEKLFLIIRIVDCVFLEPLLQKEDIVSHVMEMKSPRCLVLVIAILASLEQKRMRNIMLVWLVNLGSSPTEDSVKSVHQEKSPRSPAQSNARTVVVEWKQTRILPPVNSVKSEHTRQTMANVKTVL